MARSRKVTVIGPDSPITFAYSVDYDLFWGLPKWRPSTPRSDCYHLQTNADLETVKLFFEHVHTGCPMSLPNMAMAEAFSDLCDEFECHTLKDNLASSSMTPCDVQTKRRLIIQEERISELELAILALQAELHNVSASSQSPPQAPRPTDSRLKITKLSSRIDRIERQNTTLTTDNQKLKAENKRLQQTIRNLTQRYDYLEGILAQQQLLVNSLGDSLTRHLQWLENHDVQISQIAAAMDPSLVQPPPT